MPRQPQRHGDTAAGVHAPGPSEARDGPVYDIRAFARTFVLIGLAANRVRVRHKNGGTEGTLSFTSPPPLLFHGFLPDPGRTPPPTRPGPRP